MPYYTYVGLAVMAVVVIVTQVLAHRRNGAGAHSAKDAADPERRWVQGVLAIYRGDVGDPGYWKREDAEREIQQGWSTPDHQELQALIQRYVQGECNVAFDKARIIWLARIGAGAGWLDEATSWRLALDAKRALQTSYPGWPELIRALEEGRAQWYGGADKIPPEELERKQAHVRFAQSTILHAVMFR